MRIAKGSFTFSNWLEKSPYALSVEGIRTLFCTW